MTFKNICKFLSNEPLHEFASKDYIDIKDLQSFNILSSSINKDEDNPIFLIGPWGSGKTVMLNKLKAEHRDSHFFFVNNFFGIGDVDEAQAHLIGFFWRFLLFSVVCALLFGVYNLAQNYLFLEKDLEKPFLSALQLKGIIGIALTFLYSFVIRPQNRFLFLGALFFQMSSYYLASKITKKKIIFLIEDLDRSSLSLAEKFSFLAQLPPLPVRYIVAYGYNSETEYVSLIEYINKLNGIAIELKQDPKIVFQILNKYIQYLPFTKTANWMSELSIRELLGCYYLTERTTEGFSVFEKKVELILSFFDLLKNKKIKSKSPFEIADLQIEFSGGKFDLSNKAISYSESESDILRSFYQSIEVEYFYIFLKNSVDQEDKAHSNNWIDDSWRKLRRDRLYRNKLARKNLE